MKIRSELERQSVERFELYDASLVTGRPIDEIAAACRGGQSRLALTLLGRLVPEFEHNSEGLMPVVNRP